MAKRYVMTSGGLKSLDFISFMTPLLGDTVATQTINTVTCIGSDTPNQLSTPGAWVEIDASLSADASGVWIIFDTGVASGGVNTNTLLQIGTGAAASETVWATFAVSQLNTVAQIFVPGFIASGSRVAVRVFSAAQALKSVAARYAFTSGSNISAPTTYNGASPATAAQGVSVTTGSATEGSWTEIVASTTADIDVVGMFIGMAGDTGTANGSAQVDIGYGAASSEVAVLEHFTLDFTNGEAFRPRTPNAVLLPETIPAGSRLVARAEVTTGASLATVDVTLVTAYKP